MTIKVNKFMLYGGWEVRVGKNCAGVLKSEDKVFFYTDRLKQAYGK